MGRHARPEIICFVVFNLLSAARLANVVGGNISHLKLQLYFWTCNKVAHLTEHPADEWGADDSVPSVLGLLTTAPSFRAFIY